MDRNTAIEAGRLTECPRCRARIPALNAVAFDDHTGPRRRHWTVATLCVVCDVVWTVRCSASARAAGRDGVKTRLRGAAQDPLAKIARQALGRPRAPRPDVLSAKRTPPPSPARASS